MKTEWDYTELAKAYVSRPEYAPSAINEIFQRAGLQAGCQVCDVGAGVAHLTIPWLERGLKVHAVEPNDAMRALGIQRTAKWGSQVTWFEGTGEQTGMAANQYDLVSFGSSFNVCDRQKALQETYRLLKPNAWFCCLWNHRDLQDPIQAKIEAVIQSIVPSYAHGTRREDQTDVIVASKLFTTPMRIDGRILHEVSVPDCVEAWRSHATLARQAKDRFPEVVDGIAKLLTSYDRIQVPYQTAVWLAQKI